jgi:hypothetical protein
VKNKEVYSFINILDIIDMLSIQAVIEVYILIENKDKLSCTEEKRDCLSTDFKIILVNKVLVIS